jgi:hypothetical protein
MAASKRLTDEQRKERARKAGLASHTPERYVKAIIARAPVLTPEQTDRIVLALRGAK